MNRVDILKTGIGLTSGDRDKEYGDPKVNMACAGELKETFRKFLAHSGRPIASSELEALDMVMTKLSRLACGKPKLDTYVDMATYAAIAGECALASTMLIAPPRLDAPEPEEDTTDMDRIRDAYSAGFQFGTDTAPLGFTKAGTPRKRRPKQSRLRAGSKKAVPTRKAVTRKGKRR